jgi:hypothetical protein
VSQDYAEAARLLKLAAAQGDDFAQSDLGNLYSDGKGVSQDYAEAARLYQLAAAQGNAIARFNLGSSYSEGKGVAQDVVEAAQLWRLAAAQGCAKSQYNLGIFCMEGGWRGSVVLSACGGHGKGTSRTDSLGNLYMPRVRADLGVQTVRAR